MKTVELPLSALRPAPWNPNQMDQPMHTRLRRSITRFGPVAPLVVRPLDGGLYEVIGGNQRLAVLHELGVATVSCVLVEVDDAEARLLSQALNHIAGEDNPGLRGALLRQVLRAVPEEEVLGLLGDSAQQLHELCSLGQEEIAARLAAWERSQPARLHHLQLQLTTDQLKVVERAIRQATPQARKARGGSPNLRGSALWTVCRHYLACHGGRP